MIDAALSEYQDHFDGSDTPEEIIYNGVNNKISEIFKLTNEVAGTNSVFAEEK